MISVELLSADGEARYDDFLRQSPDTLLYASAVYRRLLKETFDAADRYLLAFDEERNLVGALPAFVRAGPAGAVLNSLPFYGSNGDLVEHRGDGEVRAALIGAFDALARDERCVSSTVVTSPLDACPETHWAKGGADFVGQRIGQLTELPGGDREAAGRALFGRFHHKTRNMVRKAEKSGVAVACEDSAEAMAFLYATHQGNMEVIGGAAKPKRFFDAVRAECRFDRDYRIYIARIDGVPVAGLLLFFFNRTVEYYTPVVVKEFRGHQPLSLIIHQAMVDAAVGGSRWWNWGGTWASQDGVYRFKSRWGTVDRNYFYYTRIRDKGILRSTREQLLADFAFFYVAPFDELTAVTA